MQHRHREIPVSNEINETDLDTTTALDEAPRPDGTEGDQGGDEGADTPSVTESDI